jgi:hypothetical protein
MPVILSQHFSPADRTYEDAEFALYHYPRVYFSRIRPYDRFIYYRPLGKTQQRADSKHYFGHGVLGQWFEDPHRSDHRFVPIIQGQGQYFPNPVPLTDARGLYYETESTRPPQGQAAVRDISETAYYRILAVGDVSSTAISLLPNTETLVDVPLPLAAASIPRDTFREIVDIPPGAGYVPSGNTPLNVYESAALQERARADHQNVLTVIQHAVQRHGGSTWYNNNVDLFAKIGDQRFLIEAKSLNDARDSVNRVRYGIGQLADYAFRYDSELQGPMRVLAMAARPPRETAWLGLVLDQERTAFLLARDGVIEPMNETARQVPFIG